jgi:hypothetical protein
MWASGNEDNESGNVSKVLTFDNDEEPLKWDHQYADGTDFGWTFHRTGKAVSKFSMD